MSIWTYSKLNLRLASWNTSQHCQLILHSTIFCWKVASCSSLYWTIRSSHRRCYVKKSLCYSLQDYNNINKKLQHRCFLVKYVFFFCFWTSILKNASERLLLENTYTYNTIYCFVNHLFVIFLVWFPHKYNFKSIYFRLSNYPLYKPKIK